MSDLRIGCRTTARKEQTASRSAFGRKCRAIVVLAAAGSVAQAQVQDTIHKASPLLVGKDALLLGAFTLGTALVAPIDRQVATRLQDPATQENQLLHATATGFRLLGHPGAAIAGAGLYLIGRGNGQLRVQALGLHSVESIVLADILGVGIKTLAGRQRPYLDINNPYSFQLLRGFADDRYRSFPSGHTITAFAFASTVARETQFWWPHSGFYVGTIMYGGAALVGLSRMYNNQHWASDVMGGAAIGTLIGLKVVKYTHSHPGNSIDRRLLKAKMSQAPVTPILFSVQF
ncbi:MAG: phosphatase PAP2 family protein [Gemmatimonadaceae bacterium]